MSTPSSPTEQKPSACLCHQLKTPAQRLRLMGYVEGLSLLLLVGIAVPIKYIGHDPRLVHILGPIHGVAFLAYCLWLVESAAGGKWKLSEIAKVFAAAFIPLGFLFIRRLLARKIAEA